LAVYAASFLGLTLDRMGDWGFALTIGTFAFMIPMILIEYPSVRERTFFWVGFSKGRPNWTRPAITFLGAFFFVHFVLFLVLSHGAAPQIVEGNFVLNNHGRIIKELTKARYLSLKGDELRIFATGWIYFYFIAVMYWWFPRQQRAAFEI